MAGFYLETQLRIQAMEQIDLADGNSVDQRLQRSWAQNFRTPLIADYNKLGQTELVLTDANWNTITAIAELQAPADLSFLGLQIAPNQNYPLITAIDISTDGGVTSPYQLNERFRGLPFFFNDGISTDNIQVRGQADARIQAFYQVL